MDIKIIGAGLGGLTTACLLAKEGHRVTILEKNAKPGGKINEVRASGFRFDTGPSLLTMPFILDKLFEECGKNLKDYLDIQPIDPICRYFYPDGTQFDCYQKKEVNIAQLQKYAPTDVQAFIDFHEYAAKLYNHTKDAFLFNPLYGLSDLNSLDLTDFFKIDAFKTVSERIDRMFESTMLRKFFKRFTTYNGSSPYQAPATLNVIPHVELAMGGFYIDGGIYTLVEALTELAYQLGVSIQYETNISAIETDNSTVSGIRENTGEFHSAEIVVSNADAAETYLNFLPNDELPFLKKKKMNSLEPSCSGFVLLLGIDKTYSALSHHNIFFSDDYKYEFEQIFEEKVMPDDPTIYIANTSYSNPKDAPKGGSNLFILVNAPYLSDNYDWDTETASYTRKVIRSLQKRGLKKLKEHITYSETITPKDFYKRYRSNKGSIYGTSSNSKMAAFLRPRNKSRSVKGLYLVGGSTHPGGGIPLVTLSAFHACELISRFE
ncbi:phytoene desaturase family protein [Fodinibius saliphilus]|uniref:phytoene desaturase family protein n=1 Tax=Fodinibius saliphilus TaxID=1920650 RepID=UPI0011093695|nr:phytoene desaturase family protein [Fodinibius saliphilus]